MNEQIKLATEPTLRLFEKLCTLLASWNELGTDKIGKSSGFRRHEIPAVLTDKRWGSEERVFSKGCAFYPHADAIIVRFTTAA